MNKKGRGKGKKMKEFLDITAEFVGNIQRVQSSLMIAQHEGIGIQKIEVSEEKKQELQKALGIIKGVRERVMEELKWNGSQKK